MIKFTNINRIFAKLQRDYGSLNLNEADVIEWAGEALSAINAIPNFEKVTKFFYIKNYQIKLPIELTNIVQIIRLNNSKKSLCNCINEMAKDEDIVITSDTTIATEKDYIDIVFNDLPNLWYSYNNYNYDVVRLNSSTFNTSFECTNSIGGNCDYEYTIINGEYLRFNFTDTSIAMSYNRILLDSNGYPLIPDTFAYTNAITKYIIYKMSERKFFSGDPNSIQMVQKSERDWNHYCSQAASESMIPSSIDEMQNFAEMWKKPIQGRPYYTLFQTLGREQNTKH